MTRKFMTRKFTIAAPAALAVLALAPFAAQAAPDGMPQLDYRPSCRAAAAASTGDRGRFDQCAKQETAARDKLEKEWTDFHGADRNSCGQLARMGYNATYTELLTCLEMARDARALPDEKLPPATTGAGR